MYMYTRKGKERGRDSEKRGDKGEREKRGGREGGGGRVLSRSGGFGYI